MRQDAKKIEEEELASHQIPHDWKAITLHYAILMKLRNYCLSIMGKKSGWETGVVFNQPWLPIVGQEWVGLSR